MRSDLPPNVKLGLCPYYPYSSLVQVCMLQSTFIVNSLWRNSNKRKVVRPVKQQEKLQYFSLYSNVCNHKALEVTSKFRE